ncbi:Schwann cell myelin protein-like isoform X2 [Anoplopoma fimbria]|uniref:Schwann cell myelin protein-like isoform X2 n=1 Tax=Anoplopoma fimbria TaxID=229290 RepID=UPI0023EB5BEE|nr:Schwann cell myelin protein-like isoform X2 [Anoplopoma fimbria]
MPGLSQILLSFCILGNIVCGSRAWLVKMPSNIKGLLGSCLVIPCTFDYYQNPPLRPDRVVWYQYHNHRYPVVYDKWNPNHVIDMFRSKTRVLKECSLEINPVTRQHHRQRLYPWVDPENIGKYTYRFFDTTVTIEVVNRAEPPNIMIYGSMKVGQAVTVQCTVYHTCSTYPPTLSLNIPLQSHNLIHSSMADGTSKTTLMTTLNIERDQQTVECSVRHTGGLTAKASNTLNAACSFSPLTISHTSDEFLEGQASKVTCTVSYTCPKPIPTLTWNYGSMPASTATIKTKNTEWRTVSTLTFTASAKDHGQSLTCIARFIGGQKQEKSITLRVKRNMLSRGWSFTTPGSITGMRGSCIIIPCTFSYSISQPTDLRVIWYLFQSNRYPAVFDEKQSIISKFNGITSLIGSVGERNCSLKIERLEMLHNQDRLYPWVDKNPITSYHSLGHTFYEKTTQLIVSDHAQQPQLSIIGIPRVEEESTVSCNVRHSCGSAPPTLTLNGILGKEVITDTLVSDGIWESTVERTWLVQEEDQSVKCTVSYRGGQKATSELKLNVECPYDEIKMTERPGVLTEGVAKWVICSVSYKCKKNKPTIVWNYEDIKSSLKTKEISGNTYNSVSNLTFIGSLGDDGKPLTCTAQFATGKTSDSEILHIKKYDRPVDPYENDTLHVLAADVPFRFSALTRSCVVIPCSFPYQEDEPVTRGIWSKKTGSVIYHNAQSYVVDHFKGRTRILGDLNEGNCSLEINDIKPFDNGPFCFHAEKGNNERLRFNNSCVFIVMKASPGKPVMTSVPAEIDAGSTITVSCSVTHTCPSHPPVFSWSVPNLTNEVTHTSMPQGIWQTTSTITFVAAGGDGAKSLTCTALWWGDKQQAHTVQLTVKGLSSWPVAIAVSALVLIVIILAAVFGVVFCRRRKCSDDSLRPPPRPEKRRSLWDRVSRGSIWRRFSRTVDGHVDWENQREPRNQGNTVNYSVGYLNGTTTVNCDTQLSKQRFPSPKDNRRPPHSVRPVVSNAVDFHVYGNY